MEKRNIIVIGASAGGAKAITRIISDLPKSLDASVFVVWHMSPNAKGILPNLLNKHKTLHAEHAIDGEVIRPGRVYVAPPDRHMLIEEDHVRVTRGPKENRFRPAIDPLFRSAAQAYGPRVLGVILSGALDDGSAGLWTIKKYGGMAIVQDPEDAEVPAMPKNAIAVVKIDYSLPARQIGLLLSELTQTQVSCEDHHPESDEQLEMEIEIAKNDKGNRHRLFDFGVGSPFTCPECHGVLACIREGDHVRYRCHTGHAFSTDSLLSAITEHVEEDIWNAIRSMQESVMLLNHIGDHFAERNFPKLASMYFRKAKEAEGREQILRKALAEQESLTGEDVKEEVETHKSPKS